MIRGPTQPRHLLPQPACAGVYPQEAQTMYLVTGATGTMGRAVLNEVAKSGAEHCAMYRSSTDAARAPAGTSTVIADFSKKDTLPPALEGVTSVYLVCSPIPQLIELEWNM